MKGLFRIVEAGPGETQGRVVWINLEQVVSVHEGEGTLARYAVINVAGGGPRQRYHVTEPAEQVVEAMRRASQDWRRPLL